AARARHGRAPRPAPRGKREATATPSVAPRNRDAEGRWAIRRRGPADPWPTECPRPPPPQRPPASDAALPADHAYGTIEPQGDDRARGQLHVVALRDDH